ncbi:MAG TPA: hypothetical protein PLG23_07145 [Thermoflexales bacterium]|jgi:hypothetical protein|nr:hypothetical protein [Thermoflexales bacterium]HQY24843.1 hypothetical protein [Thermoflexales bacterium]HQZ53223.1 hypothetical protein [Thermoflexales bacterium]HRA52495.1 hypothetical protein [Thermoflexales bacterium]
MTARRAIIFICVAAILAGVFTLSAAVLTRWMASVPQPVPLDVPLASLSLPLDGQGLGSQVIEGNSLTFRVQPYPPVSGAPVTITLVAIRSNGELAQFTPAVSVSAPNQVAGPGVPMRRLPSGGYEHSGMLFSAPGPWRITVDAPILSDAAVTIPIDVTVR